jgi:hypothetical protein
MAVSKETMPLVVSSYVKFMARRPEGDRAAYADLWDRLLTMRGQASDAKGEAARMGLDPLGASWHCRKLREGVEYPTGADMLATVAERMEAHRKARAARTARPAPRSKYHPGAPTLPGNRSPSA